MVDRERLHEKESFTPEEREAIARLRSIAEDAKQTICEGIRPEVYHELAPELSMIFVARILEAASKKKYPILVWLEKEKVQWRPLDGLPNQVVGKLRKKLGQEI